MNNDIKYKQFKHSNYKAEIATWNKKKNDCRKIPLYIDTHSLKVKLQKNIQSKENLSGNINKDKVYFRIRNIIMRDFS